ncbi:MAG: amidohydrolase family protein [Dehalococcoidia bacterium]
MPKLKLRFGAISTDDHIQEAPHVWTSRMSAAAFGDSIPHVIEREDGSQTWLINGEVFPRLAMVPAAMPRKPSEYFHRQVYANFWYEHVGIEIRRHVGVDRIMWETDFPHTTSTYPNSGAMRESCLAGVPHDERRALLVDNGVRLYKLEIEE